MGRLWTLTAADKGQAWPDPAVSAQATRVQPQAENVVDRSTGMATPQAAARMAPW